jgi:outer membrane protein assembly factor BamD
MSKRVQNSLFLLLAILAFASCSEFRKIQKSTDWKVKYDAALAYYEDEDYYRAIILFDAIIPYIRGSQEAELVQFYYAYAHYHQRQYLMASHYFKTFYETYNRSEYAEEAFYMYAYSLYKQSPNFNLDQSSTIEAVTAMQTFVNRYPSSEYREQAITIIDELMHKLELKAFENAKQYFVLRNYNPSMLRSSLIALENFIQDYPDSEFAEEASFLLVEASYRYAKESYAFVQKERFLDTIEYYENFIDEYPESEYVREAESYFTNSREEIERLTARNY